MFLEWNVDLVIGYDEIDNEHKGIVVEYSKLYNLMKEGNGHEFLLELMNFLEDYINTHFDHEEKIQEEIGYPDIKKHKELHNKFKEKIMNLPKINIGENVTDKDLVRINLMIKDWLVYHICEEDSKIAKFIRSKNENMLL